MTMGRDEEDHNNTVTMTMTTGGDEEGCDDMAMRTMRMAMTRMVTMRTATMRMAMMRMATTRMEMMRTATMRMMRQCCPQ